MKRLLALILAMAMTFSVVMPSVAAAAESSGVSSAVSEDGSLSVLEAQESSSAANKSSEKTEKEASVEKSSEKESSSETTEPSAKDEEHSSEKEETSPEKESSEGEKQDKEKNAPVESVQFEPEESSVREEDSEQEASAQETLAEALESKPEEFKTVKGSLKGVDGTKYTVTLVYGENAEIPDGAKLSLVELNTELTEEEKKLKENKDRPYDTEKFLSEKALEQETFDLHQGLKVQEKDYVLFTNFLDISLEKNGKTIQPKAPVSVTVETDAVEEGASDALELAFYDKEATKKWKEKREKLVKEQEEKIKSGKLKREDAKRYKEKIFTPLELANETEKKKGARVTFMTEEIARLGISGVAKELKSWKVKDNTVSVYGPRSLKAKVNTESMKTPEAGVEKMRAFSVETSEKTAPDYDVTYWVGTQAQSAEPEGLAAQAEKSAVDAGVVVSELKNSKAKKELIGTEGTAAPVAIQAGDKIGVAYDTGLREKTVESDKVTLEGMLPKNADVTASDMLWRYSKPEDVKEDVQQGEAETMAAYDITIKSRNQEFQPDEGESVGVSISGVKVSDKEKVEIWHVRDDGSVEVIRDFKVKGDTVSFKAEGFSVYMVVQYTVDFHWGEYTYNLEGGSTIFLSELLETLINGASEKEDTTQLKKVRDNFDKIVSVTFTDSELLAIDKVQILVGEPKLVEDDFSEELIENLRDDWRIVSLKPFTSNEMLTIKMKDGSSVQVPVTDEIWGDDAGETVTSAGGSNALPRVTADGVTYIIRKAANYADVYAISAGCTIHDEIYYKQDGKSYPTKDIDQGVGRLTRNKNKMDWELVLRAADYEIELPQVVTNPATDPIADGYVAGTNNDGKYKVWKKATYKPDTNSIEYSMKYFQSMKKVPLDFIFIYDDSASMYSGTRISGGVRMSEAQVTRVMLLDAAKALLDGNTLNGGEDYDFRIYLGGTSTGDERNSLESNQSGFDNYQEVANYLATYNTGVTDYTVGFENAVAMARASVNNKRTPIVVWLSDFHQGLAGSDFALADELHSLARVYGLSTDYTWPNLKVRTVCTSADTVFNIRAEEGLGRGIQQLQNLIWHAIGYYMDSQVTVTDNLSSALSGKTPVDVSCSPNTEQAAANGKETWTMGGSGTNQRAATMYEETFSVDLDPNTIYAGAMPTNADAIVTVGGKQENIIPAADSPLLGTGINFVLGKTDAKGEYLPAGGTSAPTNPIQGITFTLKKDGSSEVIYTTEATDENGCFTIPYSKTVTEDGVTKTVPIFELDETYVLTEGDVSGSSDIVAPDSPWLIHVATDGKVTVELANASANQTPAPTIIPGTTSGSTRTAAKIALWNEIVVAAKLVPVTVQKVWEGSDADHQYDVPFTVYGVNPSDSSDKYELKAYSGSNEETASQVRYLKKGECVETTVGANTIWTRTVWVPDKVETSGGEVIFCSTNSINLAASGQTYSISNLDPYKDEDGNVRIKGNDTVCSYAIEEGTVKKFEDGWYNIESDTYESDVELSADHVMTYDPPAERTYGTGDDYFNAQIKIDASQFYLNDTPRPSYDVSYTFYTLLLHIPITFNGDAYAKASTWSLFGGTEYNNKLRNPYHLFYLLKNAKLVISNNSGSKVTKAEIEFKPDNFETNSNTLVYQNIKLPKEWQNQIANLTVDELIFTDNADNTIKIIGGGTSNTIPDGAVAIQHLNTNVSGADSFTVTNTSNKKWITEEGGTNSLTINTCTLSMTNTWNENPLIPVKVTKKWVNERGGSVPTEVVDVNTPITFTLKGTTPTGGEKKLKLFGSDDWTDPKAAELSGYNAQPIWTDTYWVPTYDNSTYNSTTGTCEAYSIGQDSLTEGALEIKVEGENRGSWTTDVTYSAGQSSTPPTTIDAHWEEWQYSSTDTWYLVLRIKQPTGSYYNLFNIDGARFEFEGDGTKYRVSTTLNRSYSLPYADYTNKSIYYPFALPSNITAGTITKIEIKKAGNWYDLTSASGTKGVTSVEIRDTKGDEHIHSGSTYATVTAASYEKWVPEQTIQGTTSLEPAYTITNTFSPNNAVELVSIFEDDSADSDSTARIKRVYYTVKQGDTVLREVYANADMAEDTLQADRIIYLEDGNYTIEQSYTLEDSDSATRYGMTAFDVSYKFNEGAATSGTTYSGQINDDCVVTFTNERQILPVVVQTEFDPALTNEEVAKPEDRPLGTDRSVSYELKYRNADGQMVSPQGSSPYALNNDSFAPADNNYRNTHDVTTTKIPAYSVKEEFTQCAVSESTPLSTVFPDYETEITSEEKTINGASTIVFTIRLDVRRATIFVEKHWDNISDTTGVELTYTLTRTDGKPVIGTTSDVTLTLTSADADSEEVWSGNFSTGKDSENEDILVPVLRSVCGEENVKYILTETASKNGSPVTIYYPVYVDVTGASNHQFEQTNPSGKDNKAKFRMDKDGIYVQVTNADQPYICKIVESFGTGSSQSQVEVPFRTLNAAVTHARENGDGQPMSADHSVNIEMLVDYVVPQSDKVTLNQTGDNITITTAATEGGVYNFTPTFTKEQGRTLYVPKEKDESTGEVKTPESGDSRDTAILQRGWNDDDDTAMFVASKPFAVDKTIFDGKEGDTPHTGQAIKSTGETLTIQNATFRNFSTVGNGGSVRYENDNGSVSITSSVFIDCEAKKNTGNSENEMGRGGGLFAEGTANISFATFTDCYAATNGGGMYLASGGTLTDVEVDGDGEDNALPTGVTANAAKGGAVYLTTTRRSSSTVAPTWTTRLPRAAARSIAKAV